MSGLPFCKKRSRMVSRGLYVFSMVYCAIVVLSAILQACWDRPRGFVTQLCNPTRTTCVCVTRQLVLFIISSFIPCTSEKSARSLPAFCELAHCGSKPLPWSAFSPVSPSPLPRRSTTSTQARWMRSLAGVARRKKCFQHCCTAYSASLLQTMSCCCMLCGCCGS